MASAPALRRVVFADDASGVDERWRTTSLLAGADSVDVEVLAAIEAEVSHAHRMVIVHTSGSTSEPKGVVHRHGALIRHLDNLNQLRRFAPPDQVAQGHPGLGRPRRRLVTVQYCKVKAVREMLDADPVLAAAG